MLKWVWFIQRTGVRSVEALGLQDVSHTVLVRPGAAQDQRRAWFERSEFARRPERTLAALEPLGVSCNPRASADRIDLSFLDMRIDE